MPGWINTTFLIIALVALIPPALIVRARFDHSREPRIHVFPDMDNQKKYKAQSKHPMFVDGRSSRPPAPGTVARGQLNEDDHLHMGVVGGNWATELPAQIEINEALFDRGQERFEIFCSPCHGYTGHGDGSVHVRASNVSSSTWVQPMSLHKTGDGAPMEQSVGQIFNTISNGKNNMPPYRNQINPADRWAIVAYVRALQRSQDAKPTD